MNTWLSNLGKTIATQVAAKCLGIQAWALKLLMDALFKYLVKPVVESLEDFYRHKKQEQIDKDNLTKYEEAKKDGVDKTKRDDAITDLLNGGL